MQESKKNYFKYVLGFVFCLSLRLVPLRAPNIETILAVQMPFARAYGGIAAFSFGFFSIVAYDLLTSGLGIWTLITAIAYGALGLWAVRYFKNRKNNSWDYVKFAVMSTLVFDAVTGLSVGPLFFQQPFLAALTGQVPFTALHLLGNVAFAFVLSPAIYNFVIDNKKLKTKPITNPLYPKVISIS